eukprot:Pgem_evm1s7415
MRQYNNQFERGMERIFFCLLSFYPSYDSEIKIAKEVNDAHDIIYRQEDHNYRFYGKIPRSQAGSTYSVYMTLKYRLTIRKTREQNDYEDESTTESRTESTILRTEELDYEDESTTKSTTENTTESTELRPRATGLQKKVRSVFVLNISDELRQRNEKMLFGYCINNNDGDDANDPNDDDDTNDPGYTGDPSYTSYTSDTSDINTSDRY